MTDGRVRFYLVQTSFPSDDEVRVPTNQGNKAKVSCRIVSDIHYDGNLHPMFQGVVPRTRNLRWCYQTDDDMGRGIPSEVPCSSRMDLAYWRWKVGFIIRLLTLEF